MIKHAFVKKGPQKDISPPTQMNSVPVIYSSTCFFFIYFFFLIVFSLEADSLLIWGSDCNATVGHYFHKDSSVCCNQGGMNQVFLAKGSPP